MSVLLNAPLTMSSREIAELTGKQHKNVIRDIQNMLNGLEMDGSNLIHHDNRGYIASFDLTKELTYTLMAGYNVKLRNAIIKRWMELEEAPQLRVPQTLPEALRLAAEQAEELDKARPKALAFDELANTEGTFTLRDSAKLCGWPEKRFIQKLVQDPIKWLYVQTSTGRKHAYAKPIKEGYMDVKQVTIFHKTTGRETYGQPVLTQKGLTKIATKLGAFSPEKSIAA